MRGLWMEDQDPALAPMMLGGGFLDPQTYPRGQGHRAWQDSQRESECTCLGLPVPPQAWRRCPEGLEGEHGKPAVGVLVLEPGLGGGGGSRTSLRRSCHPGGRSCESSCLVLASTLQTPRRPCTGTSLLNTGQAALGAGTRTQEQGHGDTGTREIGDTETGWGDRGIGTGGQGGTGTGTRG